jgi:membrane-bound lytic murein transglycosylase B
MVLTDSGLPFEHLVVERFDYSPVDGEWAVVELLAGLGTEPAAPSVARLLIEPAGTGQGYSAAAETYGLERRLRTDGPAGFEVLWATTFSVPLAALDNLPAAFTLLAGDRHPVAVTLPAPVRRDALSPILSVRERRPARPRAIGSARQIAAVATTVAVTATSVPAAALATQVTTPTAIPAPAASATTATTTATTPAPTGAPTAAPATTPASHHAAASVNHHAARHSTSHKRVVVSQTQRPVRRAASSPSSSHTTAGASGCATTDTAGPIAYAAGGHSSAAAGTHLTCRVRPKPASPPVGASMSFGTPSGATSTTTSSTTTSTTSTTGTTPATPSAPVQPGKPAATPVSHHAAPAAHHPAHHAAKHSSGGASVAPTTPRSTSTPAPEPSSSSTTTTTVTTLSNNPPGFSGPQSWTGTVQANPALTGAVTELSGLLSNGNRPPSFLIPIYMEAGRRYHLPWEVLAAINAIETDYGRNLNTSSAGAVGWMQFEPSTWAQYGMAVDGHSVPNPYDPRDAIFSAARYLAAAGAAQNVSKAVFAYNHASWYVDEVMSRAQAIATHAQFDRASVAHGKVSVYFATRRKTTKIRFTGGVLSHYDRLIAAANMVSAANFPYVWGGGHTQPARFGPFDCSGSVSYVMQQAGYKVPTSVSGDIGQWKFPTGPGAVTIFYNPTHTFMRIGNRYFGTSGFARPGGGAGWFDVDKLPASYLANFSEVHVPDLGPNSFDGSQPPLVVTPLFTHHRHRHTTSTLSFLPLMSTLGPFPGAAALPALPA